MKPMRFLYLSLVAVCMIATTSQFSGRASADPVASPTLAPTAPPPGLAPTTATLSAVLSAWRTAEGKPKARMATEVEVDSIDAYGLTGIDRTVTAGKDYRDSFTLGPVTTQSGDFHGQKWRLNENGIIVYEIGVHKKNEIDAQALRAATTAPTAGVTLAGEVQQPFDAYVLKLNPPDGRLEWLYIDKKTSLLGREDDAYPDKRLVVTYDDYRAVNGIMEPWHTHLSDGWPANEADVRIKADDVNVPVSDSEIKIPDGGNRIATFPPNASSVVLPARVDDGSVVVRITINGRGLDFLLDSGASGILMDSDVAKELGIKTFGESVQTTMGSYEATQAIIPEMDVGPVTLHNTYVECVPFTQQLGYDTKIVGLLGFDFIANAVVSIDYDTGTVTAAPPETYAPPANVLEVPVALDDGVPYVQVQIGEAIGDHFILDTGADMIVVFSQFADAHPDDVADQGFGKSLSKYLPFVTARGVGGEIQMSLAQLASYHFGTVNFRDFLAFRTQSGSAFESEDTDGLVGYEVLQYFNVTLDYKDGMVFLKPGEVLRSRQALSTPAPHPQPT